MDKHLKEVFYKWIPFAITTTLLCGLMYFLLQQNYRMSANDPQIQLSEDVKNSILAGQNPAAFIPGRKLDLSTTLATFIILYDKNKKLIGSSVSLDNKEPIIPTGVLDASKKNGETKITWQPKNGVREALVVNYYKGSQEGYVAIGRSLREVEKREDKLFLETLAGWFVIMSSTFGLFYLFNKRTS